MPKSLFLRLVKFCIVIFFLSLQNKSNILFNWYFDLNVKCCNIHFMYDVPIAKIVLKCLFKVCKVIMIYKYICVKTKLILIIFDCRK